MSPALEATGLGVRYRRTWVLRDCSLSVPAGRVAALVGPNGAGKTTLMHAAVGLLRPALGSVRVAGEAAFVAQDKPLYDGFTVAEMLTFGRRMNTRWDDAAADRLAGLGIPLERKVSGLSGGQQAQVAATGRGLIGAGLCATAQVGSDPPWGPRSCGRESSRYASGLH
ncbi:ABC transporter ATP-binding protein [Nonomuraea sp. NPDC000554]|uniref:ABC transporter ATP-binding protein n=1 Tax=Nonomuraea sp. NPDC000554 TaxID=3154259 RepID=UPI0033169D12